jgi:CubicO group peptidase (beta-lactamase class C family)
MAITTGGSSAGGAAGVVDPDRLDDLRTRIRKEIDDGILPSCSYAVGLGGEIIASETFGDATDATRYVIFSCTKAFVAGVMWQLIGEGRVMLGDRVVDHFEEFGANGKDGITIEQVMTHTAGFPRAPLGPGRWGDRATRVEAMANWRLNWEPGSRFEYHPTSAHWVLGEIIERIDGRTCGDAIEARISEPLGLDGFRLGVAPADQGDVARVVDVGSFPTPDELEEVFGLRDYELGEVTPEALMALNSPDALAVGVPGGGGVGRARDLARYYQGLLHNPGGLWDPEVLVDGTGHVRNMHPDPVLGYPASRTAGITVANDDGKAYLRGMGHRVSARAFGHNGAGGQIAWADPATGLSFCYLTDGLDRHIIRESRRVSGIASRAALLTTPIA